MNRRCGASKVVDLIDLEQDRLSHIMPHELKFMIIEQMSNVLLPPGKKIVQANDFIAFGQQSFAQVRSDKSGAAGY
jgi:hypothetical protein